jgi:hypothetical protein
MPFQHPFAQRQGECQPPTKKAASRVAVILFPGHEPGSMRLDWPVRGEALPSNVSLRSLKSTS